MIIVLMSSREGQRFVANCEKVDPALAAVVRNQLKMEALLPDDNLPAAVLLTRLDDSYACIVRSYDTTEEADRAWERFGTPTPPAATTKKRRRKK